MFGIGREEAGGARRDGWQLSDGMWRTSDDDLRLRIDDHDGTIDRDGMQRWSVLVESFGWGNRINDVEMSRSQTPN